MSHGSESGRLNLPFAGIATFGTTTIHALHSIGRIAHRAKG